jgi:AmiR/NasT family two-component response regulator
VSGGAIDFRALQVMVVHPRDRDGELIIRQLQHLGSCVRNAWPPCDSLDPNVTLLFCLIDPAARVLLDKTAVEAAGPAVIGIVDPHDPAALRILNEVTPHSVITRPIQPASIAANVVLARSAARHHRRQAAKLTKLEETLRAYRKVEQAKAILMERRKIGEPEAYRYLREQAMRRRLPVGTVAAFVVESNEVLSDDRK